MSEPPEMTFVVPAVTDLARAIHAIASGDVALRVVGTQVRVETTDAGVRNLTLRELQGLAAG